MNPYPYTLDNKRYQTWNYYSRTHYGAKAVKVPLDAGFTCPNRDGHFSYGGCAFCRMADDFPLPAAKDLACQYAGRLALLRQKWPAAVPIAYFQAGSNTYADPEALRRAYAPFLGDPEIRALVIATRADCLSEAVYDLLKQLRGQKELWVELGVQSAFDQTTDRLNCAHRFDAAREAILRLAKLGIRTSAHLINGLPGEDKAMMVESARELAKLPISAVKFHALLILRGTRLAREYARRPFPLLTREEYLDALIDQLEALAPETVIERAVSDAPAAELIAPAWAAKKTIVLNELDKRMRERDSWQGKRYGSAERH